MSFILPPSTAPGLSAPPTTQATARQDEQGQNKSGSFGEALSRSMEAKPETSADPVTKAAAPTGARRPSDSKKTDADDLVNAMALVLPPLEIRTAKVVPTSDAGSATATASGGAAVSLSSLLANTAVPVDVSASTAEAEADTSAEMVLQPLLTSIGPKDTGQTTLQAKLTPVNEGPAIQVDMGKIAGQSATTDAGTSDPSAQGDGGKNQPKTELTEIGATPTTAKAAPANAAPALVEATVSAAAGSPVSIEAVASASSVSPAHPVITGVSAPGPVSTPNTPQPVVTATLRPEVGSSEWGKALGQQVIQMGTAGNQVAELQLNPPGLGPLKVTLSMNEHQVQAMFVSAHSSVRAAVEAALPQLRTTLADSGISLGNTSVSSENQQQTAFAGNPDKQPGGRTYRGESTVDASAPPARPVAESSRRSSGIGLDTYA